MPTDCLLSRRVEMPVLSRWVLWTCLSLTLLAPSALLAGTFTHTFTTNFHDDLPDVNPGNGICGDSVGDNCTLRAAVEEANALYADAGNTGTFLIEIPVLTSSGSVVNYQVLDSAPIDILAPITLRGILNFSPPVIDFDGFSSDAGLKVLANVPVHVENLKLRTFNKPGLVHFANSELTIDRTVFTAAPSTPASDVAALTVSAGTATCTRCFFGSGLATPISVDGGELRLIESVVDDNTVTVGSALGAGIRVSGGDLHLLRTTVSNNTCATGTNCRGGGLFINNTSKVSMVNSTLSGNSATASGGGFYVAEGTVYLQSTTIADNQADSDGNGGGSGGGFEAATLGVVQAVNSVIANNDAGCSGTLCIPARDCSGNGFESLGSNAVGFSVGCTITPVGGGPPDLVDVSIPLEPLGDYGGVTDVHAFELTSLLTDAGDATTCVADDDFDFDTGDWQSLTEDQRTFARPVDADGDTQATCDIGAFELSCAVVGNGDDPDGDDLTSLCDNCDDDANPDQVDFDSDGFGDVCDNCPMMANADQTNSDSDAFGDACDNCETVSNPDQLNSDGDTLGDACDNCPTDTNPSQNDGDLDGAGDACDNCNGISNPGQFDFDNDDVGDVCDNCPTVNNSNQTNSDGDSLGDACDNCPEFDNQNQADGDLDGVGDICDNCPDLPNGEVDSDGDGTGDVCDSCTPDFPGFLESVTCASCGSFDLYRQPLTTGEASGMMGLANSPAEYTSDAPVDLTGAPLRSIDEPVGGVRFWAVRQNLNTLGNCSDDGATVHVLFHADDGGQPGAVLAERTGIAVITDSGFDEFSGLDILRHDLVFDDPVPSPDGPVWVGYYATPTEGCRLRPMGDNYYPYDDVIWSHTHNTATPGDLAICLAPVLPLFADGFENGDAQAWSSTTP